MTDQIIHVNNIDICYETFGDPSHPPMLLVCGLGMQMMSWPDDFCKLLVERGFYVIRYDNRDSGLSTKFHGQRSPGITGMGRRMFFGTPATAPYSLNEMADDGIGLLDALGIESAHVFGVSMGGMICQMMAIRHPARVRTLTSMMSTTGETDLKLPTTKALKMLLRKRPPTRAEAIDGTVEMFRYLSAEIPFDEARYRKLAEDGYDRMDYPAGVARHLGAVAATAGRREALRRVTVPALVIHGEADPLVPVDGGKDTAAALPNAVLLLFPRLGHTLPAILWDQFLDAIVRTAKKVEPEAVFA